MITSLTDDMSLIGVDYNCRAA